MATAGSTDQEEAIKTQLEKSRIAVTDVSEKVTRAGFEKFSETANSFNSEKVSDSEKAAFQERLAKFQHNCSAVDLSFQTAISEFSALEVLVNAYISSTLTPLNDSTKRKIFAQRLLFLDDLQLLVDGLQSNEKKTIKVLQQIVTALPSQPEPNGCTNLLTRLTSHIREGYKQMPKYAKSKIETENALDPTKSAKILLDSKRMKANEDYEAFSAASLVTATPKEQLELLKQNAETSEGEARDAFSRYAQFLHGKYNITPKIPDLIEGGVTEYLQKLVYGVEEVPEKEKKQLLDGFRKHLQLHQELLKLNQDRVRELDRDVRIGKDKKLNVSKNSSRELTNLQEEYKHSVEDVKAFSDLLRKYERNIPKLQPERMQSSSALKSASALSSFYDGTLLMDGGDAKNLMWARNCLKSIMDMDFMQTEVLFETWYKGGYMADTSAANVLAKNLFIAGYRVLVSSKPKKTSESFVAQFARTRPSLGVLCNAYMKAIAEVKEKHWSPSWRNKFELVLERNYRKRVLYFAFEKCYMDLSTKFTDKVNDPNVLWAKTNSFGEVLKSVDEFPVDGVQFYVTDNVDQSYYGRATRYMGLKKPRSGGSRKKRMRGGVVLSLETKKELIKNEEKELGVYETYDPTQTGILNIFPILARLKELVLRDEYTPEEIILYKGIIDNQYFLFVQSKKQAAQRRQEQLNLAASIEALNARISQIELKAKSADASVASAAATAPIRKQGVDTGTDAMTPRPEAGSSTLALPPPVVASAATRPLTATQSLQLQTELGEFGIIMETYERTETAVEAVEKAKIIEKAKQYVARRQLREWNTLSTDFVDGGRSAFEGYIYIVQQVPALVKIAYPDKATSLNEINFYLNKQIEVLKALPEAKKKLIEGRKLSYLRVRGGKTVHRKQPRKKTRRGAGKAARTRDAVVVKRRGGKTKHRQKAGKKSRRHKVSKPTRRKHVN